MDLCSQSQFMNQPRINGSVRNLASTMGHLGRPPLPSSRPSATLRLSPLGSEAPATPDLSTFEDHAARLSMSPSRAHSPGHLGRVRRIRHSLPSPIRNSYPEAGLSQLPWGRMAELASSGSTSAEPVTPRRSHKDVRSRRLKQPADFGAGMQRTHSCSLFSADRRAQFSSTAPLGTSDSKKCAPLIGASPSPAVAVSSTDACAPQRRVVRCDSLPPTGTAKSDDAATLQAKAKAVATLQRLFLEEMAKGTTDPNAAAAQALRRLSELPREDVQVESMPENTPAKVVLQPPPEIEVPAECPEPEPEVTPESIERSALSQQCAALAARPVVPRRPSQDMAEMGARRRPRPASRVAVRS